MTTAEPPRAPVFDVSHGLRERPERASTVTEVVSPETLQWRGRILFVAEAFGGGMFEITRMQAEGLARIGFTVAIAYGVRPETPNNARDVVDRSVEIFALPWSDRSLWSQLRAQHAIRRCITAWQPDLIHLMSSFAGLHGALASAHLPTVYTPQAYSFTMGSEPQWKRWAYFALENFVAGRVNTVGACSLSEGEQARSLPGGRRVAVVPNGIDELNGDASPVVRTSEPEPRVVAIGRPLPQRRPEACARILSAVSDVAEVQWLGGGRDESDGTLALQRSGIPMSGWLPRDQILAILAGSAVYLHWTGWDGLPLSVLEALALDVIVVASDIGPNREVLGPEQVCRTEAEAIDLIRRILANRDLAVTLRERQRSRRGAYGADAMVLGWANLYDSLVAGHGDALTSQAI